MRLRSYITYTHISYICTHVCVNIYAAQACLASTCAQNMSSLKINCAWKATTATVLNRLSVGIFGNSTNTTTGFTPNNSVTVVFASYCLLGLRLLPVYHFHARYVTVLWRITPVYADALLFLLFTTVVQYTGSIQVALCFICGSAIIAI